MKRRVFPAALLVLAGAAVLAWAEDQVSYFDQASRKEETVRGLIEAEGPGGIRIKTTVAKKEAIKEVPATEVRSVIYGSKKVTALEFRQPQGKESRALQPGTKPAARQDLLKESLELYRGLDAQVKDEPRAHRYLQWKIAEVQAQQAKDDPTKLGAALAALTAYKTEFNNGWEVVPCLKLLAQLLEDKGDAAGASQAYADLAAVPDLPKELKQESEVLGVRLLLRVGKFPDAEAKLKALQAGMARDDPQRTFVDAFLVQSQMAQGNLAQAEPQLRAVVQGAKDPAVQGLAHNLLGDYYRLKNQPEQAFWEYLRVDVLYNADREEHAKALFHLSKLFDKVKNDPVRAEECLTRLKGPTFAGTNYQRQVGEEKK
jgi:hypothetical protein